MLDSLQVVNNKELVNNIATVFLCPQTFDTTTFNPECNGHLFVGGLPNERTKVNTGFGIPKFYTGIQTKEQQS
jgi:hypothetical protein